MDCMPLEMLGAYLPYGSHLKLEEAARVAAIRDDEAAANLALSAIEVTYPETTVLSIVCLEERKTGLDSIESHYPPVHLSDGCGHDRLSVEPPSLR